MTFPVPRTLSPSKVIGVHRLRARLPVLGDRPAARAAVGRRPPGARWSTPRSSACTASTPPIARPRPRSPASTRRRPRCATIPSSSALELDDEATAAFHTEAADLVRNYFRLEDPTRGPGHRPRAAGRGRGRRHPPPRHHRPARARRRRRAGGHRLQDRRRPVDAVRAQAPVGRAHLLAAVRRAARPAAAHRCSSSTCASRSPSRPPPPIAPPAAPGARSGPCGRRSSGRAIAKTSARSRPGCATYCAFQSYCPSFGGDPAEAQRLGEQLAAEREAERAVALPAPPALVGAAATPAG